MIQAVSVSRCVRRERCQATYMLCLRAPHARTALGRTTARTAWAPFAPGHRRQRTVDSTARAAQRSAHRQQQQLVQQHQQVDKQRQQQQQQAEMAEHVEGLAGEHQTVLVLDYGSQYTQLIARRIREFSLFSILFPGDASLVRPRVRPAWAIQHAVMPYTCWPTRSNAEQEGRAAGSREGHQAPAAPAALQSAARAARQADARPRTARPPDGAPAPAACRTASRA